MGWADSYIKVLRSGKEIGFRPRGNSMTPYIKSGALVQVVPISNDKLPEIDDVVLCTVAGSQYLHFVTAIKIEKNKKDGTRVYKYQISNARGRVNGWTSLDKIYGRAVKVVNEKYE